MKIAIVGAGIIGVTTAYELAHDGHEVTVLEQRSAAAEEASFANAGLLSPYLTTPCTIAGKPSPAAQRPWHMHTGIRLAQGAGLHELAWLWRWRRSHTPLSTLESLARYSRERTKAIAARHELDFEASTGRLLFFRTTKQRAQYQPLLDWMREAGTAVQDMDADAARQVEPGLSPEAPLHSAVLLPHAVSGNCRLFAQMLRQGMQGAGVQFVFNAQVTRLSSQPTGIWVNGEPDMRRCDAVVVCAGAASHTLLSPRGIRLPMAPVFGYSVSAPLREATHAPLTSALDVQEQITITRQGQRVRITGGAELGSPQAAHHHATLQKLYRAVNDWFPGGAPSVRVGRAPRQICSGPDNCAPPGNQSLTARYSFWSVAWWWVAWGEPNSAPPVMRTRWPWRVMVICSCTSSALVSGAWVASRKGALTE